MSTILTNLLIVLLIIGLAYSKIKLNKYASKIKKYERMLEANNIARIQSIEKIEFM